MTCSLCRGTGRLPVIGLISGKPIPHAWYYCSCQHDEAYQPEPRPEDFDWPCSESFRGYYSNEPMPDRVGADTEVMAHELGVLRDWLKGHIAAHNIEAQEATAIKKAANVEVARQRIIESNK